MNAFKLCGGSILLGAGLLCGAVVLYWGIFAVLRAEISVEWVLRAAGLVTVAGIGCGALIGGGVALIREGRRGLRADNWGDRGL